MAVFHSTDGQQFVDLDRLRLSLIEITDYCVSIGVSDRELFGSEGVLSTELSEACRNRSCYFWFGKNGGRILVIRCRQGQSVVLSGSRRLTVVGVSAYGITVAITGMPRIELSLAEAAARYGNQLTVPRTAGQRRLLRNRESCTIAKRILQNAPFPSMSIAKFVHAMVAAMRVWTRRISVWKRGLSGFRERAERHRFPTEIE